MTTNIICDYGSCNYDKYCYERNLQCSDINNNCDNNQFTINDPNCITYTVEVLPVNRKRKLM